MRVPVQILALCALSYCTTVNAQEPLFAAPVNDLLNCFQCCKAVDTQFDADLRVLACQEGCQNNVRAIDADDAVEKTSFDLGVAFNTVGHADFQSGGNNFVLLCSPAADFEAISKTADGNAEDVSEAICQACCTQLNSQFDSQIDDAFSVDACQNIGCDDDIASTNCGTEESSRDEQGCNVGLLFRTDGGTGFRGLNHVCTNNAVALKTFGATLVASCETCCDLAIAEVDGNIDAVACKEQGESNYDKHKNLASLLIVFAGCGAVDVCAQSPIDQRSCDIGRGFLLNGLATINSNTVQCFFDHADGAETDLNVFINVNEINGLQLEELIAISVGSVLGVGLASALLIAVRRRRNKEQISYDMRNDSIDGVVPGASFAGKPPPAGNSSYGSDLYGRQGNFEY